MGPPYSSVSRSKACIRAESGHRGAVRSPVGAPPTIRRQVRRLGRAAGSVQGRLQALQAVRSGGWRSRHPPTGAPIGPVPPAPVTQLGARPCRAGRFAGGVRWVGWVDHGEPSPASPAARHSSARARAAVAGAPPAAQARVVAQDRAAGARQVRGDARGRVVARLRAVQQLAGSGRPFHVLMYHHAHTAAAAIGTFVRRDRRHYGSEGDPNSSPRGTRLRRSAVTAGPSRPEPEVRMRRCPQ